MATYRVRLEEITEREYEVEAEDENDALAKAEAAGSGAVVDEVVTWPTILDVYEVEDDV